MRGEPDVLANLRSELGDARVWLDRVVVIGFAVLAGLVVVLFALLADGAFDLFLAARAEHPWMPLLWTPLVTAAVVWTTQRWFPAAAGSGIPQVCAVLDRDAPPAAQSRLVTLRLALAKVGLVTAGLAGGLSIGRQGPSVQVAAGVMLQARRWLSPRSGVSDRDLVLAGGAAGIAASFNTPLGGIVFAIEELSRRAEYRGSGLMLAAIVAAGLVAVSALGNLSYFGRVQVAALSWWDLLPPGALVALASGALGGLLARLLIVSFTGLPDRFCALRRRHPVRFAAGCGFAVALICWVTQGAAVGGGHHHTQELLRADMAGGGTHLFGLVTLLKLVSTWLSTWSGAPGGILGPSLSLGASLGADVAQLLESPHAPALIALGMAGCLAAVTQAPITAMIIVMEMTDGHAMVLSLMACAMLASGLSRLISRPLFPTLADQMLLALRPPPAPPDAAAGAPAMAEPTPTPATPR